MPLYCKHCKNGKPYNERGLDIHQASCPAIRKIKLRRLQKSVKRKREQEKDRLADVQDVNFEETRENLTSVIDHNAQPTMVPDQLVAVPLGFILLSNYLIFLTF